MKYLLFCILFWQLSFSQKDSVVNFGQHLIYESKHDQAVNYFTNKLEKPDNSIQEVELLLGLAEVYKLKMDFNKSKFYYTKAFKKIKKINNHQLEFLYYVKTAEFYRKRALFKEAAGQLDKANKILKKYPIDEANMAKYYSRKAALFTEYYNLPDSTLAYAEKSLKIAKKINDKDNIFYSSLEIACVYERKKDYKSAIIDFEELIEYSKKNNLIQQEADVYINYANVLIKDNQVNKALSESLKAIEFAKENNLLYNENVLAITIYEIYKSLNNYEKAYEYLEYRLQLSEQYHNLEHDKFLFELEEKYKLAEKENQIKINTLELANKDKELAANQVQFYIIAGMFLVAILITFLIAYFLRKTKITNKELQFLSQQNQFLLSEANHRINNNLQLIIILISDRLNKLPENEAREVKKILKKVNSIATLHRHLYQSEDKTKVNTYKYLNDIKNSFMDMFLENNIIINFEIEPIELSTDVAMYLGLLLTELCINSIKHAFIDQEYKEITFELKKQNDIFYFRYSDNGTAIFPENIRPKLISKICRQLKVNGNFDTSKGFSFSFEKIYSDKDN